MALSGFTAPLPTEMFNLHITSEMKCCTSDVRGARLVLHLKVLLSAAVAV